MIVVSNRIPVNDEYRDQFEEMFRRRAGMVEKAPGFIRFEVLRPIQAEYYQILTYWRDRESFENWTQSPEFRQGHSQGQGQGQSQGRPPEGMFRGQNVLEIAEVVQEAGQPLG